MKLLTIKKSLLSLAIATLLTSSMPNAMAVDVILLIPNFVTSHDQFKQTRILMFKYGEYNSIIKAFETILMLPFAILDEDTKTITTNKKDLEDLGYKQEEIVKYQKDLESLKDLFSKNKFSSKEEAEAALDSVDLGIIAKEQLRLN